MYQIMRLKGTYLAGTRLVLHCFLLEENGLRFSGVFDFLLQHFLLPGFTPYKHTNEVYYYLIDSIHNMNPDAKSKLLKKMATVLVEETHAQSNKRVEGMHIS